MSTFQPLTITEALAEIKTASKKILSKRAYVLNYLTRPEGLKDPLEKDGGSAQVIERERQGIKDLEDRIVSLRRGIQKANEATEVTVGKTTKTIADWLIWRREVAPTNEKFLNQMRHELQSVRTQAQRMGAVVLAPGAVPQKPNDIIVNLNEANLMSDIEGVSEILSTLDGQLSMKNATTQIAA